MTNKVEHMVCQTPQERDCCRESKYIQSHIDKALYDDLEKELMKGTPILYIGTSCQVVAALQYVSVKNINAESLVTCGILCYGVGSPGIWKNFWSIRKQKMIALKRRGWEKTLCVAKAGDKEISLRGYSWLYFSDSIMRPVCYKC